MPSDLQSETGIAWLRSAAHTAEFEVENGPGGAGWKSNESLRPAIQERAAFLRALLNLIS